MIPSEVQLSVLIEFGGWGKSSSLILMRRDTVVCPFFKNPLTYDLAAETTTCLSILNSVWIAPFAGGGRFLAFVRVRS